MLKHKSRQHRVRLDVQQLEDRFSPTVTANYAGVGYYDAYTPSLYWSGKHIPEADYVTQTGASYRVLLDPFDIAASTAPSATWKNTLENAWPGWTFNYSNTSPANLQITIRTYEAYGSGWANFQGGASQGGQVAGLIESTTNYTPAANQKARWIQVVTTNCQVVNSVPQMVNPAVNFVDVLPNATEPYYPGDSDQRGFLDYARRPNITDPIRWRGEVFFVVETGLRTVTVYPEGFTWGWYVEARNANSSFGSAQK